MDVQPLPTSPHPDKQAKNDGVRKRAIHLNGVTDVRAAVLFVPLRECETSPKGDPKVIALNQWCGPVTSDHARFDPFVFAA